MNKSNKVILGLAAAVALAAVGTVLIEPKKVKKFSKRASKKGKKLWNETKEAADELVQRVQMFPQTSKTRLKKPQKK